LQHPPRINSLKVAKKISEINDKYKKKIFMVFVTVYTNYTHAAFQFYAFDYLVKQFKIDRIRHTVERISDIIRENQKLNFKFTSAITKEVFILNPGSIFFATKEGRRVALHTDMGKIIVNDTLEELEKIFKDVPEIVRCHRGYIVNISKIVKME
jgi:two-component system LytT family response regulator